MRIQSSIFSFLTSSALLSGIVSASGFSCEHINVDGVKYNLNPLGGVHSIYHVDKSEEFVTNTTYVLNICNILKGAANRDSLKCGTSKNICGFEYKNAVDGSESESRAFPIAGLEHLGQGSKDPEVTRLKKIDPDREGLMVRLAGGQYIDENKAKKEAGAVIEFQCDPTRSGLEGLETTDESDQKPEEKRLRMREEVGDKARSLQFKSFGPSDNDSYVLKLDWLTRYACDDYLSSKKGDSSGAWGFFTWFIVMYASNPFPAGLYNQVLTNMNSLFLCTAAYLIFGSWLNYNRYGARGWDLLPHSDTIRDVPYIMQDWFRRVVNTLQGTGTRGGYSAV